MANENNFLIWDTGEFMNDLTAAFFVNVKKKLDEYKDIIPPKMKKKIHFCTISDLTHCIGQWTRFASKDAAIRRNELVDHVMTYQEKWLRRTALTTTEYHVDNKGFLRIDRIDILAKTDSLCYNILENMERLPIIIEEFVDVTSCHEAGHAIDNIQLMEGANEKEYEEKINKPDHEAYDQYYKWRKEFIETLPKDRVDKEGQKLIAQKYYQCPAETRADILGGIDRAAALDKYYDSIPQKGRVEIRGLDEKEFRKLLKEYKANTKGL